MTQPPDAESTRHKPEDQPSTPAAPTTGEQPADGPDRVVDHPSPRRAATMPEPVRRLWESVGPRIPAPRGLVLGAMALALPIMLVLALLVGGVAWWAWPADGPRVVPGTVQASVLDSDEVSKILGTTLNAETRTSQPAAPLAADPPGCSVAVGPATEVVYQRGWTTFLSVTYQDSDAVAEHTATQVIGEYQTTDQASTAFATLTEGINACTRAVRLGPEESSSKWTYRVNATTTERLAWTATQDEADGWACYREARLKATAVLQVAICQAGDGRPAARTIADQFAGRVKE